MSQPSHLPGLWHIYILATRPLCSRICDIWHIYAGPITSWRRDSCVKEYVIYIWLCFFNASPATLCSCCLIQHSTYHIYLQFNSPPITYTYNSTLRLSHTYNVTLHLSHIPRLQPSTNHTYHTIQPSTYLIYLPFNPPPTAYNYNPECLPSALRSCKRWCAKERQPAPECAAERDWPRGWV